jgi:predicted acylesterase/phospholipase RssA
MNGVLLELGFLKRLRNSGLWPRVGLVAGTSAGALCGCIAVIDRLDDLEEFVLGLQPEDTFRANRLWRLPLLGPHDYVLPKTIAERLGDPVAFAHEAASSPIELVVVVTDVTVADGQGLGPRLFERAYSSRSTPPEEMAQAVLASAAISALVLPQLVGDRVATDGGWVRNYPLGYAYEHPEVQLIVSFRYEMTVPVLGTQALERVARRLRHLSRLPAARGLARELEEASARERRGQPAHVVDLFARLARVAIIRNTALEELVAGWRERSVEELRSLHEDVLAIVGEAHVSESERTRIVDAVERRFAAASFPFRHDRVVPRITVAGTAGRYSLQPGFRSPRPWTIEAKRTLIERGYRLADRELAAHGVS